MAYRKNETDKMINDIEQAETEGQITVIGGHPTDHQANAFIRVNQGTVPTFRAGVMGDYQSDFTNEV